MPVFLNQEILTLLGTVGSAILTAIVTYKVAVTNANRDIAVKGKNTLTTIWKLFWKHTKKKLQNWE